MSIFPLHPGNFQVLLLSATLVDDQYYLSSHPALEEAWLHVHNVSFQNILDRHLKKTRFLIEFFPLKIKEVDSLNLNSLREFC